MTRLARFVSALDPRRTFFGPIFDKEMRVAGRRVSTYVLRGIYAAALLAVVSILLINQLGFDESQEPATRIQQLQRIAPMVAIGVVWIQFVGLAIAAPMLTGSALSDERHKGTLSALLTTPLTAAQIVGAKLASGIAQLVVLAALATPILLAIRVFGGFDARLIIAAAGVSFSTAVLGAALGLFFSLRRKSGAMSSLFAILSLIVLLVTPLAAGILVILIPLQYGSITEHHEQTIFALGATCAPFALAAESARSIGDTESPVVVTIPWFGGTLPIAPAWVVNIGWNFLLAAGVIAFTVRGLRRVMTTDGPPARAAAPETPTAIASSADQPTAEPATSRTPRQAKAARRSRTVAQRRSREVGDAPILWREMRTIPFGSRTMLIVGVLIAIAAHAALYWYAGIEDEGLHVMLGIIGALGVLVQATFTTTFAYATERQRKTWDTLLTTPISPTRIVLHKWLATLHGLWLFPAMILAHQLLMVLVGVLSWMVPLHTIIILAGPVLLLASTGNALGLAARRATVAQILNFSLAFVLWIVLPIAPHVLDLAPKHGTDQSTIDWTLRINPMIIGHPIEAGTIASRSGPGAYEIPGFDTFSRQLVTASEFTVWSLTTMAGYLLVSAFVLLLSILRFNRLAPRAS